jgi:hypothetical protein
VNCRYGFHLLTGGRYQDNLRNVKTIIEKWLLPRDDKVSRRILYRLVRGFFMVPRELACLSDTGPALQCADHHPPDKWNCFGETETYLKGLAAPESLEERDEWLDQQRRAVAVFRTFCGKLASATLKSERAIVGDAYGEPFEAFRKAVEAYYLPGRARRGRAPEDHFVNVCPLPPLFARYISPADDAGAKLSQDTYEVEGDGMSAFRAALTARFDRTTGEFKVHGSFCPPPYGSPIAFTRLDVFMARPDDHGMQISGLSKSETDGLSQGYRAYRTDDDYAMQLSGKSTDDIDNLLREGFHVMTIRNAAKPFSVRYRATTPLANIKAVIDADATNANAPRTTPNEVVIGYLKSVIAPMQADWAPPHEISVIDSGVMHVCDKK